MIRMKDVWNPFLCQMWAKQPQNGLKFISHEPLAVESWLTPPKMTTRLDLRWVFSDMHTLQTSGKALKKHFLNGEIV